MGLAGCVLPSPAGCRFPPPVAYPPAPSTGRTGRDGPAGHTPNNRAGKHTVLPAPPTVAVDTCRSLPSSVLAAGSFTTPRNAFALGFSDRSLT